MLTEQDYALIDEVMDNFDFRKVADVMQHLKWTWYDCKDVNNIPEENTLRGRVRGELKKLLEKMNQHLDSAEYLDGYYHCGGFVINTKWDTSSNEEPPEKYLNVSFVLTDWDTV